ncbi:hypothetical protein Gpo141_00002705 [Globisporangium polare]
MERADADTHSAGVNNSTSREYRRAGSGGNSNGVDTSGGGGGGGQWRQQKQKQSPGASHRDRSVSMNMNAPPSKKHRASDDENEQGSPSQRERNRAAKTAAAGEEDEADEDVARPRRGAGASPGAIDDDDDDESSEGSLTASPAVKSKPRAFSLDQASRDASGITEESFMTWLVEQKNQGIGAGQMLDVLGLGVSDGVAVDDDELWEAMFSMGIRLIQPSIPSRQKLDHVNTLQDVADLLRSAKKVVILAGAGISVSCGIPDFRSENGIYSRLGEYNLPNPQCMFDIEFFRTNPRPFFAFAKELFPKSNGFTFVPSRSHYFLKLLEDKGKLLRIYSQNIDMLEHAAGISHERSVLCHGSFATATCLACKRTYPSDAIRDDVANQRVPMCKECNAPDGIVKPDIVFFGESLPRRFHDSIKSDENEADLVLVMGSSLKVNPVRSIVGRIHKNTPMVLINREPVGRPHKFDVELLGYSDDIVEELCRLLEWEIPRPDPVLIGQSNLSESVLASMSALTTSRKEAMPFEFIPPSRHMFNGALANSISSSEEEDDNSSSSEPDDDGENVAVVGMEDEECEQKVPRRWNEEVEEDHDHLMGSGNELLRNSSFEDISQHD